MEDLLSEFTELKISALSKSILINQFVDGVTIGPNATKSTSPAKITTKSKSKTDGSSPATETNSTRTQYLPPSRSQHSIQHIALSNIEKQRKEQELSAIDTHSQRLDNFKKQQEVNRRQQWKQQQASKLQEIQSQECVILQAMQQVHMESARELEKVSAQNRQRQLAHDKLLKARAEQQQLLNNLVNDINKVEHEFAIVAMEIENMLKSNQEAKSELGPYEHNFKLLHSRVEQIHTRSKTFKVVEQDLRACEDLLKHAKQLKDEMKSTIMEHYKKREKEAAEQVAILRKKEEVAKAEKEALEAAQKQPANLPTNEKPTATGIDDSQRKLKTYSELQVFLQNHEASYKQLLDDQNYKQFKFDCKKAVNIPVNAISSVSSQHLVDKYNKLYNLLSGKPVKVGDNQLNASQHPQGVAFSMDLLARKFVLQGDLTISSNPEAAFAYAAVIVALWNDFPDFGKLILAHFHRQCPYLVPLYLQKMQGESDENYYTCLGYQYKDGEIEKQDKFLKRMTGISRLYFAILMSNPKRGQSHNPHDIVNGWIWFARTLNMAAYVDVTATLIYCFLEVAGTTMENLYGKQFQKLITYLNNYQMEILKTKDSGGPLVRLEVMLQDYKKNGMFVNPPGILPINFW